MPLHVLERVAAIPYAIDGDVLRVAVADPANVNAIDELRIATRLTVELAVATRDDVEAEIRRIVRASEAFGARAALERSRRSSIEEESRRPRGRRRHLRRAARPARQLGDLPGRRGRRLRHPLGAAGGLARRPAAHRRRAARGAAHPEATRRRRDDAPEGAREARHRRAAQAAGRPHRAERRRPRAA